MRQESVTVRFTIPFSDRANGNGAPLIFTHWLPLGPERGITFQHASCAGVLWFDVKSVPTADDEANIERIVNVLVESMYADVTTSVESQVVAYMKVRDFRRQPTAEEKDLADRYELHGREVLAALDHGLNRLLSFVRIEKGQHWIHPFKFDVDRLSSHAVGFRAQASTTNSAWFRWQPTQTTNLVAVGPRDDDPRFIRPHDWPNVQEFVTSSRKPTLTLELLAGAESLAGEGSERAALTEAVSALEVALASFARSARLDELLDASVRSRLGIASLPALTERMGLSASVAVLLPLLFSEDVLPADLLTRCREAIAQRQNVVHQGQRQVDSGRLTKHLAALRQLCEVLLDRGKGLENRAWLVVR